MAERIQKVLANAGLGSRRTIEEWIAQGRITVDGRVAKLGDQIGKSAYICVDGRPVSHLLNQPMETKVIIYHKPVGEVCTRKDEEGRPTVFENLPHLKHGRWISIGRLDVSTSGLLMFTNNGDLANQLMHPSAEIEREYAVRVAGDVDQLVLDRLSQGIELEDGLARFDRILFIGGEGLNQWYHVIVKEGRNRLVRRIWESQGLKVSRLIRVRFGCIILPRSLRKGRWLYLEDSSLEMLKELLKNKHKT